jgi:ATP-dependent DNA helicase RecQ
MQTKSLHTLLSRHFGYTDFRPLQQEAVEAILSRRDLLMILPTGGGKSLCYQLPSLAMEGVTIVISPLLALMHDQVVALRDKGISAEMLSSMQSREESIQIEKRLRADEISLLYVAPERLVHPAFLALLDQSEINCFVIDEAHCVSEWGHEFRESYRGLSMLRERFAQVPIAAFTATATQAVEEDIVGHLKMTDPLRLRGSLYRDNLTIRVEHRTGDGRAQLRAFVRSRGQEAGIVYAHSRKSTESLAKFLEQSGWEARAYHAGLPTQQRNGVYQDFISDRIQIVVATIAFGMGIDKSNIRYVVHMGLPKTIENYYQEIGRAGRDGEPSETLLLFSAHDAIAQRRFIDELPDTPYREAAYDKLREMQRYAQTERCRHATIAGYFQTKQASCGTQCDNCLQPEQERINITTASRKLLSAILRTDQRFGLHYVIDVLKGSSEQRIAQNGHDQLSVYAIGKEHTKSQWMTVADRLLELEMVQVGRHKVIQLTRQGIEALKGLHEITLRQERWMVAPKRFEKTADELDSGQREVFEQLRLLRREIASKQGVPPYVVFSDKTLREMAAAMPQSQKAMLDISGIGAVKYERYGDAFLALLQEHDGATP